MNPPTWLIIILTIIAIPVGIVAVVYMIVPVVKAIGFIIAQVFRFIAGLLTDAFRLIGALITGLILIPLIGANVVIGRWSAASHFGRSLTSELKNIGGCVYRIAIGHPARLFCLTGLTEGIEQRLPQAIAEAPTADRPAKAIRAQFEGYEIIGSLPGGGSGGKLYIARPDAIRRAALERDGFHNVGDVVIKTFSLQDGSSLPQIVRESRALEAAKKLGLVLDHDLNDQRFYYIMRYVPGDSLTLVTQRLHALSGADGLSDGKLREALSYSGDLLRTLQQYHQGGLWHKDVKPDNIIVDASHTNAHPHAHLVDFGLVTPLRSGMTLTTHGTEYFRDPEMVRMALKGAKVHEVDGTRFDIYAAGAVLYSLIENSFPAHGGLSQITKRCPEALRWIVRRAMTDYDKRYATAGAMLADLALVQTAADPFALKPADLPSMRGMMSDEAPAPAPAEAHVAPAAQHQPAFNQPRYEAAAAHTPIPAEAHSPPKLKVTNWWSGKYVPEQPGNQAPNKPAVPFDQTLHAADLGPAPRQRISILTPPALPAGAPGPRRPAAEQLASARARVRAMQSKARGRAARRARSSETHKPVNAGVVFGTLLTGATVFVLGLIVVPQLTKRQAANVPDETVLENEPSTVVATLPADTKSAAQAAHERLQRVASAAKISLPASTGQQMPTITVGGIELSPVDALAAVSRSFNGREILVISEEQPPSPPITAAIDRLRAAGFVVLGNVPGNSARGERLSQQLELEADAKMLRGLTSVTDHALREALANWLAQQRVGNTPVAGLVWFGAASETPATESGRALVVVPATEATNPESQREASFVLRAARRAVTAGR